MQAKIVWPVQVVAVESLIKRRDGYECSTLCMLCSLLCMHIYHQCIHDGRKSQGGEG